MPKVRYVVMPGLFCSTIFSASTIRCRTVALRRTPVLDVDVDRLQRQRVDDLLVRRRELTRAYRSSPRACCRTSRRPRPRRRRRSTRIVLIACWSTPPVSGRLPSHMRVAVPVGQDERHREPLDAGRVHHGRRVRRAAPALDRGTALPPSAHRRPAADRRRGGHVPLLVRRTSAGPQLQRRTVRRVVAGDIEALVRLRVHQVAAGRRRPLLRSLPVARPQLNLGAVGGRNPH